MECRRHEVCTRHWCSTVRTIPLTVERYTPSFFPRSTGEIRESSCTQSIWTVHIHRRPRFDLADIIVFSRLSDRVLKRAINTENGAMDNSRQFLSRVSTVTRHIDIANLSVRPSVCLSVMFRYQMKTAWSPLRGAKYRWGIKISPFSTNKSLYLANDTRHRHSYYGRRIWTRLRSIKWCHFQWPCF